MRIRVVDYFHDFDRLRSGYVTATQFRRCVGAILDRAVVSPLTEQEFEVLMERYDKGNRMIKWTDFVDSIDKVFGAKKLEQTPTQCVLAPHEVVKPVRPPLSPDSETMLRDIIERLKSYVKHHGSDVKTWFKDFDKHNNGYITINQFRRGIPQNLLSLEEEDVLLSQYSDDVTGTVNYFKMNTDVNRKVRRPRFPHSQLVAKITPEYLNKEEHVPVGTEDLLHHAVSEYGPGGPRRDAVEDKIRKHIYKDRIRLIEFFRDYDRHNCGLITEAQLRAGLRLASLELDEPEIQVLLGMYQDASGRVRYRQFCASIDLVFTVNNLESNPLIEVHPPPREYLVQHVNELAPAEEARCNEIIARFRSLVKERRLLLAPFFQDFDKYLGNIGRVTRSHFSRLLSTMKLDLSDKDLHVLFKKFEDKTAGRINYMEFVRTIDPETYEQYQSRALVQAAATSDMPPDVPAHASTTLITTPA
ncbi:hypothetical protein HK104_006466, partial [Borealophlyctis nickersoniae]